VIRRTEQHLWRALERAAERRGVQCARIEVTTLVGVSDVEYVTEGWAGWIELKVSATARPETPLRFGSPFTAEQCAWLLAHHAPAQRLRSWLLVGLARGRGWRGLVLLPAPRAVCFLRPIKPSLTELQALGVPVHLDIHEAVHQLIKPEEKE